MYFAHGTCDVFDRACANVADGKDGRARCFTAHASANLWPGAHKSARVQFDQCRKPRCVGGSPPSDLFSMRQRRAHHLCKVSRKAFPCRQSRDLGVPVVNSPLRACFTKFRALGRLPA